MTRFLVDECLSPLVASGLRNLGIDAVHVRDLGLQSARDVALLELAVKDDRVILTADHDFTDLLAQSGAVKPSVVFFRDDAPVAATEIVQLIAKNLPVIETPLGEGSIVVIHATRMQVRRLPLFG